VQNRRDLNVMAQLEKVQIELSNSRHNTIESVYFIAGVYKIR
jgi:hypothetical protein